MSKNAKLTYSDCRSCNNRTLDVVYLDGVVECGDCGSEKQNAKKNTTRQQQQHKHKFSKKSNKESLVRSN